ncbi:MAG TPA: L,D-transpeptidase [Longimicrobium sp.]|nr:L,D-transpeptidase [Longimicrobium sp.]
MKVVKRFATGAAVAVALAAGAVPAHATDGPARIEGEKYYLSVDLSERMLYVMRDGEQVGSYSVAVGQPNHPTPTGRFHIRHLVWNPRWVPPDARWARNKRPRDPGDPRNPMGRVKLFFHEPDLYIHGTRETDSLGEAESHGCVRMANGQVIDLARQVMANGGSPRDPSWFRRVLNRVTSTRSVYLSDPVLVEIHR